METARKVRGPASLVMIGLSGLLSAAAGLGVSAANAAVPVRTSTVTVGPGDTLWAIGRRTYGHRHYSRVLQLHNRIPDPRMLRSGQTIKTPPLATVLAAEGVTALAPSGTEALVAVHELYRRIEADLRVRPRSLSSRRRLPAATKDGLDRAVALARSAEAGFEGRRNGRGKTARRVVGQLRGLVRTLDRLALGRFDAYGYDIDVVHQRIVYAATNAIQWARGH